MIYVKYLHLPLELNTYCIDGNKIKLKIICEPVLFKL